MRMGVVSRAASVAAVLRTGLLAVPAAPVTGNTAFDNGRYAQMTIGERRTGTNDGAPGQPFCRNGSWLSDKYDGATLTLLVADRCADSDACRRDNPNHLNLTQYSLDRFAQGGQPVGELYPNHWHNRRISRQCGPAPAYSGEIRSGFIQSAQPHRPVITISHLSNGIHGVRYYSNGGWHAATMDSDLGNVYRITPPARRRRRARGTGSGSSTPPARPSTAAGRTGSHRPCPAPTAAGRPIPRSRPRRHE